MWWDATGYGAHSEKASAAAASEWYFAEGSQGFFHTYFLLLNPHAVETVAHVTYLLQGEPAVQRNYPLQPFSRRTIDAAGESALLNRSFGARVSFDLPGMAERAMYFGDTPFFNGGHAAAGVTAPATSWFLAEGATGSFFDTFVLIANPNSAAAALTVTYLPEGGVPVVKPHTLAANQRLTINIGTEDAALANAAVSTRVESDRPAESRFTIAVNGPCSHAPELSNESFGMTITSTQPVIVERALYTDEGGVTWSAGTDATRTRLP